jgi:hypothetical protein
MKVSPTEIDGLCTVQEGFELQGGYWFTISRTKVRFAGTDDMVYISARDMIMARGRITQIKYIDQEIIASLRNVNFLWRREGQWLVIYISLFKFKEPIPWPSMKQLEYLPSWKRLKLFPRGVEPEGEYTCLQPEKKRFLRDWKDRGTPYTRGEMKDARSKTR